MKHEIIKFYPLQVWYVKHKHESQHRIFHEKLYLMIHVIKHDIDPNSNINYSRRIGPLMVKIYAN